MFKKLKEENKFFLFLKNLFYLLKGKRTYGFYGKSGTGKSHHAHKVMEKYNIHLLIDDGLLIRDNSIIAGNSAKNTPYFREALRISLFLDLDHRKEIKEIINKEKFKKILILGTSKRMIYKICEAIGIPYPHNKNMIKNRRHFKS